MKTITEVSKRILATEDGKYVELTFNGGEITDFDSNLPYKKSIEDWDFYSRAIKRILKELKK